MAHVCLLPEGFGLRYYRGALAVIAGLAAILVSISEPNQIFSTLRLADNEISKTRSWFSVIRGNSNLVYPGILVLGSCRVHGWP